MKLDQKAIGLSLGIVSAFTYLVCIIFIAVFPTQTMNFFGWLIHIDNLSDILGARNITLANAIIGLVILFALGYAVGWLFAVLYNKSARSSH